MLFMYNVFISIEPPPLFNQTEQRWLINWRAANEHTVAELLHRDFLAAVCVGVTHILIKYIIFTVFITFPFQIHLQHSVFKDFHANRLRVLANLAKQVCFHGHTYVLYSKQYDCTRLRTLPPPCVRP